MGTITIQIPQDVKDKYVISNPEIAESLVEEIKTMQKKEMPDTKDILKGLFSNDIDLIDQITEAAMEDREHHGLRVNSE